MNEPTILIKIIKEALGSQIKTVDVKVYDSVILNIRRIYADVYNKGAPRNALAVIARFNEEKLLVFDEYRRLSMEISLTDPDSIEKLGTEIKRILSISPSGYKNKITRHKQNLQNRLQFQNGE